MSQCGCIERRHLQDVKAVDNKTWLKGSVSHMQQHRQLARKPKEPTPTNPPIASTPNPTSNPTKTVSPLVLRLQFCVCSSCNIIITLILLCFKQPTKYPTNAPITPNPTASPLTSQPTVFQCTCILPESTPGPTPAPVTPPTDPPVAATNPPVAGSCAGQGMNCDSVAAAGDTCCNGCEEAGKPSRRVCL